MTVDTTKEDTHPWLQLPVAAELSLDRFIRRFCLCPSRLQFREVLFYSLVYPEDREVAAGCGGLRAFGLVDPVGQQDGDVGGDRLYVRLLVKWWYL